MATYEIKTRPVPLSGGSVTPSLLSERVPSVSLVGAALRSPGAIRPAQITPVVNRDIVGPAVQQAGYQLGRAGLAWENDRAEMQANDATIAYKKGVREIWLGRDDGKGGFTPGYAASSGKAAVENYSRYEGQIQELRRMTIDGLKNMHGDNAASRFIGKTQAVTEGYLNSGASHAASGKSVWRQEQIKAQVASDNQDLDDLLATGDMKAVAAAFVTSMASLKTQHNLPDTALAALTQEKIRSLAEYVSTTPGASTKLLALQETFGSRFDIETATLYNKLAMSAITRENQQARQNEVAAERELTKWKGENDLQWFQTSFSDPASLDMTKGLAMVKSGLLSPSMYLAARGRVETRAYLPPIDPREETLLKQELVNGESSLQDVFELALNYDDATVRRLGNFAVQAQGYELRADLRYGYERIERVIRAQGGGLPAEQKILEAQRLYEKSLKTLAPDVALDQVLNQYTRKGASYTPELISFSNGKVINVQVTGVKAARATLKKLAEEGIVPQSEIEKAANEILRYSRSKDVSGPKQLDE